VISKVKHYATTFITCSCSVTDRQDVLTLHVMDAIYLSSSMWVGLVLQQQLSHFHTVVMCCYMQWRQTILALSIRACTLGQQNLRDWNIAVLGCNVEWSKAFLLCITQTLLPTTRVQSAPATAATAKQTYVIHILSRELLSLTTTTTACLKKTSHLWLAITLMHMNGFRYFLAEMLPIK